MKSKTRRTASLVYDRGGVKWNGIAPCMNVNSHSLWSAWQLIGWIEATVVIINYITVDWMNAMNVIDMIRIYWQMKPFGVAIHVQHIKQSISYLIILFHIRSCDAVTQIKLLIYPLPIFLLKCLLSSDDERKSVVLSYATSVSRRVFNTKRNQKYKWFKHTNAKRNIIKINYMSEFQVVGK